MCAYNWRQGTCSHELLFQATDPVQHVACSGDQLAFGTDGGGTWVISRTTGYVANVFEGHFSDVTGKRPERERRRGGVMKGAGGGLNLQLCTVISKN